jgi:phosphoserine phosphatase
MFRIAARFNTDIDTMFRHINDQLADDLADDRFVTSLLARLDANENRVHYQAGGQGPTLHLHAATGECDRIGASTVPMGIMPHVSEGLPEPIEMAPGDVLALISDGIFEARSPEGEEFGADRVCDLIRENQDRPMGELIRTLNEAVERFIDGQPHEDDMTVILIRRMP